MALAFLTKINIRKDSLYYARAKLSQNAGAYFND